MEKLLENIKAYIAFVDEKATINEAERRIRFVISTDKIDRDNERIEVSAVAAAIPAFAKNPVALASHTHRDGGKPTVIGHWDTNSFKALEHHSEMDLIFADTELGEEYWQLYKNKHMRAVSIGFRAVEYHEEVDAKNGRVVVFTKIELFEISVCAVGANRDALSKLKSLFGEEKEIRPEAKKFFEEYFNEKFKQLEQKITEQIDELKILFMPDSGKYAKSLMLDEDNSELLDPAEKDIDDEHVKEALENLNS